MLTTERKFQPSRRGLILGLGAALVAAPAIVRAASLKPIKAIIEPVLPTQHLGFEISARELAGKLYEELRPGLWERYSFAYAELPPQWQKLFAEATG